MEVHPSAARAAFRSRYVAIVFAGVLGTLAAIGGFLLVRSWEYRVAEIDFQSRAKSYLEVINADLSDADALLYTVGGYFDTNTGAVGLVQFERFAKIVRRTVAGITNVGWAPRVTAAERPAFEHDIRIAGIARGFRIFEGAPSGKRVTEGERPAYYPILYINNTSGNRRAVGFDLISEPLRTAAVARTIRTGRPAASAPLRLVEGGGATAGVMGFMAVGDAHRERADPQHPRGIVLGSFNIASMIENIIAKKIRVNGTDLYLFNPAAGPGHRLIFWRPSAPSEQRVPTEREMLANLHWQGSVLMIDQRWGAYVVPSSTVRWQDGFGYAAMTLVAGLMMTAMIVAYLLISARRSIHLESVTSSLRATTADLHANMEHIAHMARHDALTGLANRVVFRERVDEAIVRHRRGAAFAVLYLDLDEFKDVNDTLGHSAGDQLLCAAAARITRCLRDVDTVARLGGDEFALVLADKANPEIVAQIAERLICEVEKPYTIEEHTVGEHTVKEHTAAVGLSIGIAVATTEVAHVVGKAEAVTAERLLTEADLALYSAKAAGRGTYRFFEPNLGTEFEAKRKLEGDLRRGLEREEFEVYYQPIINIAHGEVIAFEALVRWNHPERGLLSPDSFIPLAEACLLIVPLGLWVLTTACRQAADWPLPVKVAVNISALQIKHDDLVASVVRCLAASGLPAKRLGIEIAEAAVLHDSATTQAVLKNLRTLGISVAFDDFGTGFASLSSLLRLPFDKLKIDRSLIQSIDASESAAAIVRAIVEVGSALGLLTAGQGVETHEQLRAIREFGCTEAQGYLLSRPLPNSEVPRLLRELTTRPSLEIA